MGSSIAQGLAKVARIGEVKRGAGLAGVQQREICANIGN